MVSNFRTYESAVRFTQLCLKLSLPEHLKEQLNGASASIALNLAEGSAANTEKERHRFYIISLRSFRESEAILRIAGITDSFVLQTANQLGGQLYRLCKSTSQERSTKGTTG